MRENDLCDAALRFVNKIFKNDQIKREWCFLNKRNRRFVRIVV
jgi:hypothetical protein